MPTGVYVDKDGKRYILVPVKDQDEMVGREYVMKCLGIKKAQMSRTPWNLPDFGEAVKGRRRIRPYHKEDIDKWLLIPSKKRREMYKEWKETQNETYK